MNFIKGCHHTPELIFSTGSTNYYAADEDGVEQFDGDLIINLTKKPGIKNGSNIWNIPELAPHMKWRPEEIFLMWEDFGTPPVDHSFWIALDAYTEKMGYKDVCFHCGMGHGRTGTALSAMLIANEKRNAEDAIHFVRFQHCKHAVETHNQIAYLFDLDMVINGRELDEDTLDKKIMKLMPKVMFQGNQNSQIASMLQKFSEQEDHSMDPEKLEDDGIEKFLHTGVKNYDPEKEENEMRGNFK